MKISTLIFTVALVAIQTLFISSCSDEEAATLQKPQADTNTHITEIPPPPPPERIEVVENKTNGQVYIFAVDSHEIVAVHGAGILHIPSCKMCKILKSRRK